MSGEQRSQPLLHFSRKIHLKNLTRRNIADGCARDTESNDELDMPFLALCRVLLMKTLEVTGEITDEHVQEAVNNEYDSVHSAEM
jgi:hypothetical protein